VSARELLERSVPFELRDDGGTGSGDGDGDGLTLEGYAAMFGEPTMIDSWEGCFYEQIRQGAFKKSIRERMPVMQFDHGRHPLIGSLPIAAIQELAEDDRGLPVKARISDNWLMQPVRDAIAEGSVTGMSFRFSVVREEWRDVNDKVVRTEEVDQLLWNPGDRGPLTRTLIEVKLHELGPVVFPAYAGTSVGMRAQALAGTIRSDGDLRRELCRSLVVQAPTPGDLSDPELRRDVARALLFGPAAPLFREHPADEEDRSNAAPLEPGHPAVSTDAPPSDGHPSPTPTTSQDRLRAEIQEITSDMRAHLATIADRASNGAFTSPGTDPP
jgi:HK97 family phage prohead protease